MLEISRIHKCSFNLLFLQNVSIKKKLNKWIRIIVHNFNNISSLFFIYFCSSHWRSKFATSTNISRINMKIPDNISSIHMSRTIARSMTFSYAHVWYFMDHLLGICINSLFCLFLDLNSYSHDNQHSIN